MGHTLKVLLVEDNPGDAELAREYIKETGYRVDIVTIDDGQLAIDFFKDVGNNVMRCPDLVLVDLNLPRRSGHEVTEAARRYCGMLKVFIYSGSKSPEDLKEAEGNGVDGYLVKPMIWVEIEATVKELGAILRSLEEAMELA